MPKTRIPHLVAAAAFLVALSACSDREIYAPDRSGDTEEPTGSLTIQTVTYGDLEFFDRDGYYCQDESGAHYMGLNDQMPMTGVRTGLHTVILSHVADNCTGRSANPQQVTLEAFESATIKFVVKCVAPLGKRDVEPIE